ncbi:MAG: ABC transporter permease [Saprospiraceae bacterium]|nr:ABC transporter permease [Saprospiraceae bacterium]
MLRNYLIIALRQLWKNKFFTGVNMFGLSVGLACCLLVSLYIYEETHHDRHHPRAADICRVGTTFVNGQGKEEDTDTRTFNTPSPLAGVLMEEFPEIEKTTRLQSVIDREKTLLRAMDNGQSIRAVNEPGGFFADSTYFEFFAYDFIEGDPARALNEPNTVVLTEEIARKLFGNQPAYGKVVRISNNWFEEGDLDLRVTGVFRQPEAPTRMKGRFFMSMYSGGIGDFVKNTTNLASNNMFDTYLLLRPGADVQALNAKLPAFVEKRMSADLKSRSFSKKQFLVPLADVHLSGIGKGGSTAYLYILGSIAAFTLLIACVNFMNLSTARSARRANEVGVRKAVGATRFHLVGQFLGESMLIAAVSFVIALGLAALALPLFNELAERHMHLSLPDSPGIAAGLLGLALLTGFLAGVYPAFYLSSFRPVAMLKGKTGPRFSAALLRKGLVVFQFVISAGLILASLVIDRQMHYVQSKDLGFYKEQQIVLPLLSQAAQSAYEPLKAELDRDSRVAKAGASLYYPGIMNPSDMSLFREDRSKEQYAITRMNWVDYDFLPALGIEVVAGRMFSIDFPSDTLDRIILNETAVAKLGYGSPDEALGKIVRFSWPEREFRFEVIGVVRDFHFEDLHEAIEPYGFLLNTSSQHNYLIARANTGDMQPLLADLAALWQKLVPGEPFEYTFLDQDFQKNYKNDRQMAALVGSFTGIAIVISCLGLFGLAAFAAERRTKEIGIRKVLGASVAGITGMLAGDFLRLVLIAIVIASPLAWWVMDRWLQDFAYRIELQWWMVALSGIIAIVIAFLTVSVQSIKAALTNPVNSLKTE